MLNARARVGIGCSATRAGTKQMILREVDDGMRMEGIWRGTSNQTRDTGYPAINRADWGVVWDMMMTFPLLLS